ncbi:hypothetical protein JCM10908_000642 [Rhodotorula pacifica]|uniref:uncharacterized protein n=1 Tax=Rhodotorula pacifica TaxID=1495444 RepID=UPI00317AB31B
MPPKATGKPKGLKASKRAAPFDPPTADSSPSTSETSNASSGPALNKEGTMPLDEDALTVPDLFELASRVLELVYPFPTSLRPEGAPEVEDDARNLLRGILHGCDVLEPYVGARRGEMEQDKLAALGLAEADVARSHLLYLQAFSLRHLGEMFVPPAAVSVSGSKRRKIDLREPQSRDEWFEAAGERFGLLGPASDPVFSTLVAAKRVHLAAVRAESSGTVVAAVESITELVDGLLVALESIGAATSSTSADATDAWYASLRALVAAVVALESVREPSSICSESLHVSFLSSLDIARVSALSAPSPLLAWLRDVTLADVKLAVLGITEDWIEARFRADAADSASGAEDEVVGLPASSAPFVAKVEGYGREAIAALRETISSFASLPSDVAHPSARVAQHQKLVEALLLSSALFDPADGAKLDKLEQEVAQVRKDGGLPVEDGGESGEEEES